MFSGIVIGISNSIPGTFNSSFNFKSVTNKFWFNNILLIIEEGIGFSLLICSNERDSGEFYKGLIELKNLVLFKNKATIELNSIHFSINGAPQS